MQLHRNPADARISIPMPPMDGQQARLGLVFAMKDSAGYYPANISLPSTWTHVGIGQTVTNSFLIAAPTWPGTYTVRLTYTLFEETNRPARFNYGYPCAYRLLEIK